MNESSSKLNNLSPSLDQYLQLAEQNLERTSRTASGKIDVSASETKAEKIQEGLKSEEITRRAKENFRNTIQGLYKDKDKKFSGPQDLRNFVEDVARSINRGITKENILIREGADSIKYPYTKITDLESAMQQFYEEFHSKLGDIKTDPIDLAAWVEYRIDLSDHFFADGCGKTAKAISSWVLMRAGKPLPQYTSREELYNNAPKGIRGENISRDTIELQNWTDYYRKLFPENP